MAMFNSYFDITRGDYTYSLKVLELPILSWLLSFHSYWIEWKSWPETIAQMLHAWYIYLQNWVIYGVNVGKYSSTMEHLGCVSWFFDVSRMKHRGSCKFTPSSIHGSFVKAYHKLIHIFFVKKPHPPSRISVSSCKRCAKMDRRCECSLLSEKLERATPERVDTADRQNAPVEGVLNHHNTFEDMGVYPLIN